MFMLILSSLAALFLLWAIVYVGQLRRIPRPRRDHRLGRWLAFHKGVR
jgi:hypothetical protein